MRREPLSRCILFQKLWQKSDQQLVQLCLKGHEPAWECIVTRYQRLVYHFPHDARLSPEDCDEVFQETFLSLYRGMEKLPEVEALDQWIATIAKRITWKTVQRGRRLPDEKLTETYDVEDPDQIPEEFVETKVQQARIRRAVGTLNERCRKLLYLLFYEYDSSDYEQVAGEVGIARGSIGPIRHRCLLKLKKILEQMGIDQKSVSRWLR
ncbi:MAG: sigma-70 family RNA polymerase sigma factor [Acidobacteriota bacterium]|nr:sigma-70 family RNA polymerase sigma factor [Acidobacteriota bacterium]